MPTEDLTGTVAELSENITKLSATIAQLQETLLRMDTRITHLENNWRTDVNRDDGGRVRNQRDQQVVNVDRDLRIKLAIPEYDGKLKLDEFMDWLVCVENIFAH
eukprot:TRINITY_DN13465_c0_g3_i2.p1 TRINITY_DN13465_c0_g3~~TRINITY_DN13465_c0_g3_i2.p1  ORF type:complete len:104 (-),score=10.68 TRINITY_DN13465_c0_g3_i2:27-338(-)